MCGSIGRCAVQPAIVFKTADRFPLRIGDMLLYLFGQFHAICSRIFVCSKIARRRRSLV